MTGTAEPAFLHGGELGDRIRLVTGGSNVRCAVAFWSEDGIGRVFDDPKAARRARIVCDISMGSTSAEALVALGAPDRKQLRHLRGLHAKVYVSDRGVVTGSANASIAALGRQDAAARLTEAGTYHEPGSPAWTEAVKWFASVHKSASKVDGPALEWARRAYRPPRIPPNRPPVTGSLLDAVRMDPARFAGVGFVFTSVASGDDAIKAAKKSAKRIGGTFSRREIDEWPRGGFFTGWPPKQVERWPTLFFEFWQPAAALTVYAKTVRIHDKDNGSILSRNAWRVASSQFRNDLPTRQAIAGADAAMSARILGGQDGVLFLDADALARRLDELDPVASAGTRAATA